MSDDDGVKVKLRFSPAAIQKMPPLKPTMVRNCASCLAWMPKPNQSAPIFGGCARGGKTTLHYGDTAYNHYTTDLQSCSAWEPK